MCQIFSQSVEGLQISDTVTPKTAISHLLAASPLLPCDTVKGQKVANQHFQGQTPSKMAKFDLFGCAQGQIGLGTIHPMLVVHLLLHGK